MTDVAVSARDITKLGWLADAPLFIDKEQVAAFYDAVVRPEAEQKRITLSLKSLESEKTTVGGEASATVSVAKWLTTIFPFLDASIGGKLSAASETEEAKEETREVELQPINSPQRQLVQLTLHYVINLPTRIRIVSDPAAPDWYEAAFVQALPRALVFLDFPSNTAFIPMAAELDGGKVVRIYEEYEKSVGPNPRPEDQKLTSEERDVAWREYWNRFANNFDSYVAMETVEKQVGEGGRIRWIDYRVPLATAGKPAHLHVVGHGGFDTGVFAYNLIQRGYRHGLRLVGTLKSGRDINVLAIFEK